MKIEKPSLEPSASSSPVAHESTAAHAPARHTASADTVRVSEDVSRLRDLVKMADPGGDARTEILERARELLGQGQIAVDLDRLADRLIEAAMEGHDVQSS